MFSLRIINGKQDMDSTCSDLKEEGLWEDHRCVLRKMREKHYLLELPIKERCSCVTGQPEVLTKLEAKTIPSLSTGTKKETLDL